MNLEKLKPWNWFKDEDDAAGQIPVKRTEPLVERPRQSTAPAVSPRHAVGSVLQLQNEMDRLFDNVWRSFGLASAPGFASLRGFPSFHESSIDGDFRAQLDIAGNDKEYEVAIDVPGLTSDDIQIELRGNALSIRGQKEAVSESKDKQYYRMERRLGSFQRTLSLPEDADAERIAASVKNGVLSIQIPRKALPREAVKRIAISS